MSIGRQKCFKYLILLPVPILKYRYIFTIVIKTYFLKLTARKFIRKVQFSLQTLNILISEIFTNISVTSVRNYTNNTYMLR